MITRLFKEIRKFFAPPEKFTKTELQHFCAGPTKCDAHGNGNGNAHGNVDDRGDCNSSMHFVQSS